MKISVGVAILLGLAACDARQASTVTSPQPGPVASTPEYANEEFKLTLDYAGCRKDQIQRLDDGVSDAATLVRAIDAACSEQREALVGHFVRGRDIPERAAASIVARQKASEGILEEVLAYRTANRDKP